MAKIKKEPITYVCTHCHKHYTRESAYIKHENEDCKVMLKQKEFKSVDGQLAWDYYKLYRSTRKWNCCEMSEFVNSKAYTSCLKFVRYSKAIKLRDPKQFVRIMSMKNYSPEMWLQNDLYIDYLDHLDRDISPIDQVYASANTLFKFAEDSGIDVGDVFDYMPANKLIQLIELRQLSAWLLLFSPKFADMHGRMGEEQQIMLENLIRDETWTENKRKHEAEFESIRKLVRELGL